MTVMKWAALAVVLLLLIVLAALVAGRLGALAGTPPADLGVRNGRLKPPSRNENSVSSQAMLYPDHPQRQYAEIAPLQLRGDGPATIAKIATLVRAASGAEVVTSAPDYLYARYTSPLMRYVDDVEFWFDPANGVVQVRSASRIGRGDLGANRKRIEALRAALETGR
ncbi:MAG: DUF1499 domain-containing protein [Burkholderiaceae bacterium]